MNKGERVNRLPSISIDGETKLYGVVGNPVKHSFSPRMHSLAFQELGINAVYLPFLVNESQLPQLLNAFTITGVQGFNITLPYKEKIVPFLDSLSDEAEILQSVNTVVRTGDGWRGYSTDGKGFMRSLTSANIELRGKKVLLAGAGGAARAIGVSLALAGVSELVILNRTQQKADNLAQLLLQTDSAIQVRTALPAGFRTDIAINTTSLGMYDNRCPLPDEVLRNSKLIIDIIYNPPQTTLLKKAVEWSIAHLNGLEMLLYQGIESFEIWTHDNAPVEIMRQSLIASLYPNSDRNSG
ncbi:MAG: shikimate dehydrogenase [SAR324 cluster bacterium]|nr:shikimate dehydrogenase [SAR324 cluster bacterium]